MPKIKPQDRFYNDADITIFLKNALLACQRPSTGNVDPARFPRLREFTEALIEPFGELADEGGISAAELRFVLASSLLVFHESVKGK